MAHRRTGFSLVELMVVLAVLAILAGLLLPAVQRGRETANQASCRNNLRQLGLASHLYEQNNNAFPPNRTPCGPTWAVLILPYLDQDNLFKEWDLGSSYYEQTDVARETSVASYFCPSRRDANTAPRLSMDGDEPVTDDTVGPHVPGALGDYAYNLGIGKRDVKSLDEVFLGFAGMHAGSKNDVVRVPNLDDLDLEEAKKLLDSLKLTLAESGDTDVGVVNSQAPRKGAVVKRHSVVNADFKVRVPDLVDPKHHYSHSLFYKKSKSVIKKRALQLTATGELDVGQATEQSPLGRTIVPRGTNVEAKYSVVVPPLTGKSYAQAFHKLQELSLELKVKPGINDLMRGKVPPNDQSPPPNIIVERGAPVFAQFKTRSEPGHNSAYLAKKPGKVKHANKVACSTGGQPGKNLPYDELAFGSVHISDGLSNTFLVGEKHVPLGSFGKGGWDCSLYNGTTVSCSGRIAGPGFALAASVHDKEWKFGSYHPGICHFLFADGSVHALSTGTDPVILGRLAHHNDGYPIPDYDGN